MRLLSRHEWLYLGRERMGFEVPPSRLSVQRRRAQQRWQRRGGEERWQRQAVGRGYLEIAFSIPLLDSFLRG